jgi:D-lactate dehydrogenase (cytochrome)
MIHRAKTRPPRGTDPPPAVETAPDEISRWLEDAAHFPGGHAAGIVFPRSENDVATMLREHRRVLPIGAQSSLTGGATPAGELIVSFARMAHVLDIRDDHVRTEPGITLAALQDALDSHGLFYPPVPTFAGATVGGTIATNAAGAATFKYGATRAWVEGLTVVLSCGEVLDLTRGQVFAHPEGYFDIDMSSRSVRVPVPQYRLPDVPKCSAGYHAAPEMDLVDLFVGSEGTLGIVTEAILNVVGRTDAFAVAFVPMSSEADAFALTAELRQRAQTTWSSHDSNGLDLPAIEYIDKRSLALVPARVLTAAGVEPGPTDRAALFVQIALPSTMTAEQAYSQIASFQQTATPLAQFCQLLTRFGAFDRTEIALPGDRKRAAQILEIREAVPAAVNELVGSAKRTIGAAIEKVAGDMIVPFDQLGAMVRAARAGFDRRGLDHAIWGHVSDGNLHPNVIPHSVNDVQAGKEAILELGREVAMLGGCPLAEHGVGRSEVKQELLRQLYGNAGIAAMRAVKRALDPEWKLAPGVLFPRLPAASFRP